jgi:hypothetical protein
MIYDLFFVSNGFADYVIVEQLSRYYNANNFSQPESSPYGEWLFEVYFSQALTNFTDLFFGSVILLGSYGVYQNILILTGGGAPPNITDATLVITTP